MERSILLLSIHPSMPDTELGPELSPILLSLFFFSPPGKLETPSAVSRSLREAFPRSEGEGRRREGNENTHPWSAVPVCFVPTHGFRCSLVRSSPLGFPCNPNCPGMHLGQSCIAILCPWKKKNCVQLGCWIRETGGRIHSGDSAW